jgi:hypothetical protein
MNLKKTHFTVSFFIPDSGELIYYDHFFFLGNSMIEANFSIFFLKMIMKTGTENASTRNISKLYESFS